jgi:hypothetical protein
LKKKQIIYNKIETISSIKFIYITNKMSKCKHGKRKTYCKECGGVGLCEHEILKHYCIECGGSSICQHGKRKYRCKECGGSEICIHKKSKYDCIDCKGSNRCEPHNILKRNCKECNGSLICEHGNRKARCKECGGSEICKHNISKYYCKECCGSALCEHGKKKEYCKEGCGGSQICEHNHRKEQCVECGGSQICIHKKQKHICVECKGSTICEHGKRKYRCRDCGGSEFCEHDKRKDYCKICDGKYLCKSSWCETIGNPKYEGYCVACFVNNPENQSKPAMRNYKTKEKNVVDRITQEFPNFTWVADKKVQDGCSRRRPDLLLDMGSHIIIMEVDENKHTDYNCSCEHKRLMELSQDLQHRPIIFIRFNPDDYTNLEGVLVKSCWKLNKLGVMLIQKTKQKEWEERIEALKQQIQYWIDNPTEKMIEIVELFY